MRKSILWLLFVGLLPGLYIGCAGAVLGGAAGVGTAAYVRGELEAVENASLSRVWNATLATARAMQFTVIEEDKDELTARVHAKGSNGKDSYINLKSLEEDVTEIRIRIDVFGDETMSRRILQEIRKRL